MRRVLVIGIGAGDPSQITVEAIDALNACDVLFEIERSATDLTLAREEIYRRYLRPGRSPGVIRLAEPDRDRRAPGYGAAVEQWRAQRAAVWESAIGELSDDASAGFLVWGDPSLYDSTIAVLDEIRDRGAVAFWCEVIPGVSSIHALTARHGISLNRIGGTVLVTTGRRLAEHGLPAGVDDVVVMLDGGCSFRHVSDERVDIYWGAYLGTQDEILVSGPLSTVAGEIERVRAEARARKGWIMDCYLLRRN
jgi:precorrin-6A synthase